MKKDNLKILLVKAPEIDFDEKTVNYSEVLSLKTPPIPLGLASLSAYMKKSSVHEIHLFDIFAEGFEAYKGNRDKEIFFKLTEGRIRSLMPDVVGISALMIINHRWVHYIADTVKKINPQTKVIVGGGYASLIPEKVLSDVNVDFIVLGEGEESLLKAINTDFNKEKLADFEGLGFRDKSGKMRINRKLNFIKNVDDLPFFDWEGIELEKYLKYGKNNPVSYATSRGCPFGCSFCSTYLMWGKKFRPLSAKRVVDEIDYLVSRYSIGDIEFRDDNLALQKERIANILSAFVERKYNLNWTCPNALAIATVDRTLLELFKKSGCSTVTIAVESGSEKVIKNIIHKPVDKIKVREIVKICNDIGLKVHTAFMVGFPGETRRDIEETRDFILELQCDWNQISIATAFPGTEMYDVCEKNNYFAVPELDLDRCRYGFANIRTQDFDEKWVKQKAYDINIEVNFLRNHNFYDNPEQAIAEFEERLLSYPKHLIAILCLGYAYKLKGENEKMRNAYQRAFDLAEKESEIYQTYKKYISPSDPIFEEFFELVNMHKRDENELSLL